MTNPRLLTLAMASAVIIAIAVAVAIGISRYHRVYTVSPGTALVSTDGRSITVGSFSYSCAHPADVVVSESPQAVSIIERTAYDTFECPAQAGPGYLTDVLTVRLREPLGRRALTDGTTGRPMPWFDQRRELTPAYLPARLAPQLPPSPLPYALTTTPTRPACTQLFRSPGFGWLTLTQLYGTMTAAQLQAAAGGGPWQEVQVRGHRGWLADSRLTWFESGQTILIQAQYPFPAAGARDAELLAIARSLR
jgi:hypothetical protein